LTSHFLDGLRNLACRMPCSRLGIGAPRTRRCRSPRRDLISPRPWRGRCMTHPTHSTEADPRFALSENVIAAILRLRPRARRLRVRQLIEAAKKAGANSITLPDGTTINFGEPDSGGPAEDSWPLDEFRTKETKQ